MKYGTTQYGVLLYGNSEAEVKRQEAPEEYTDLTKYLPQFLIDIPEIAQHLSTNGYEVGREWWLIRKIYNALFPSLVDTDWGCELWEKQLGIETQPNLNVEQRRANIIARIQAYQICTPDLVKTVTETLTGVECEVIEDNSHYSFTVQFVGQYGIVTGEKNLRKLIDEIKPAHEAYEIKYRYVTWNELADKTWDQLSSYTWDGLRINDHIPRATWDAADKAMLTWNSLRRVTWKELKNMKEIME